MTISNMIAGVVQRGPPGGADPYRARPIERAAAIEAELAHLTADAANPAAKDRLLHLDARVPQLHAAHQALFAS